MSANRPSALSLKLRRLFAAHSAPLQSLVTQGSEIEWIQSSSGCATRRMLHQAVTYPSNVLWAPTCFLDNASGGARSKTKAESCPPLPPLGCMSTQHDNFDTASAAAAAEITYLLNAAFLYETSLFTLLLCHPLPSSPIASRMELSETLSRKVTGATGLSRDAVDVACPGDSFSMLQGKWTAVPRGSVGESWLAATTPALNVQLSFSGNADGDGVREGKAARPTDGASYRQRGDGLLDERLRSCFASGDYLESLIWPTDCSGDARPGLEADCVWVDVATVQKYALGFYKDAIWVPFCADRTFASWSRERLMRGLQRRQAQSLHSVSGGSAGGAESAEDSKWLGELYVALLR